jgi:S-formylglutathione hydrolase FrmB
LDAEQASGVWSAMSADRAAAGPQRVPRATACAVATALALLVASTPARGACDPPRCVQAVVPLPHDVTVPDSTVRVLLPSGYESGHTRYPVLYLLHGQGDTFATWTDMTDVEAFTATLPVIVVMPDGGHDAQAGFYSDWLDGSRQWETFHTRVLRRWVERHWRTLHGGRHRAVAGLSMGGFGAMAYAARHPGLYRAAASFSGALDIRYPNAATPILDTLHVVSRGIWGDPVADARVWKAHDPVDLAGRLHGVALFLTSGDGTMGGPLGDVSDPLAYATEAVVDAMSHDFTQALDARHVSFVSDFYGAGYHGWPYWERELHWALPQILTVVGSAGRRPRVRVP